MPVSTRGLFGQAAGSLPALCLAFGTPASEVCVLIARGRTSYTGQFLWLLHRPLCVRGACVRACVLV